MNGRRSDAGHLEDLPWNDVPGDSSVVHGAGEPEPAEVVGDDGKEHDLTAARDRSHRDRNQRDTLAERLAEEEPEARLHGISRGEVVVAEYPNLWREPAPDDPSSEDAAMHLEQG